MFVYIQLYGLAFVVVVSFPHLHLLVLVVLVDKFLGTCSSCLGIHILMVYLFPGTACHDTQCSHLPVVHPLLRSDLQSPCALALFCLLSFSLASQRMTSLLVASAQFLDVLHLRVVLTFLFLGICCSRRLLVSWFFRLRFWLLFFLI